MARCELPPALNREDMNYTIKLSKNERKARLALALNGIKLLPNDDPYGYRYVVDGIADNSGLQYTTVGYQCTLDALRKIYPHMNL